MKPTDNTPHTVDLSGKLPRPFRLGATASRLGKPITDNPYAEGSDKGNQWRAAWRRPGMYIGEPK